MKKKAMSFIVVIAIAAVTVYNVHTSQKRDVKLSTLVLANVEALADYENGNKRIICYNSLFGIQGDPNMQDKTWCEDCMTRPARKWSNPSECTN